MTTDARKFTITVEETAEWREVKARSDAHLFLDIGPYHAEIWDCRNRDFVYHDWLVKLEYTEPGSGDIHYLHYSTLVEKALSPRVESHLNLIQAQLEVMITNHMKAVGK